MILSVADYLFGNKTNNIYYTIGGSVPIYIGLFYMLKEKRKEILILLILDIVIFYLKKSFIEKKSFFLVSSTTNEPPPENNDENMLTIAESDKNFEIPIYDVNKE